MPREDQNMVDTLEEETDAGFFMDTAGSGHVETGLQPRRVRFVSPTPYDSNEDVILFKSRYNMGKEPQKNGSADARDRKTRIVEDKIHQKEELLDSIHTQEAQPQQPSKTEDNCKARSRGSDEKEIDEAHHTLAFDNRELGVSDVEISMSQIKDKIANFLSSDSPHVGLPPIKNDYRKPVHEICKRYYINMSSYGSGKSRFPMLVKTGWTVSGAEKKAGEFGDLTEKAAHARFEQIWWEEIDERMLHMRYDRYEERFEDCRRRDGHKTHF